MIDGLEPFYQRIAESIQAAVRGQWTSARMDAIFYDDSILYFGEYLSATDGLPRDFETSSAAERAFEAIRRRFKETGQPLWGQACFVLQSDGKFNVKWGYENCDEQGNTKFDEAEYHRIHEERRSRLNAK